MDDNTKMLLDFALNDDPKEFKQHVDSLQQIFNFQQRLINQLKRKNETLESDTFKDEELKYLRDKVERLEFDVLRGFSISEEEDAEIRKWQAKHDVEAHGLTTLEKKMKAEGCCGGRHKYIFVPTSIGVLGRVECECGEGFTFQELI